MEMSLCTVVRLLGSWLLDKSVIRKLKSKFVFLLNANSVDDYDMVWSVCGGGLTTLGRPLEIQAARNSIIC